MDFDDDPSPAPAKRTTRFAPKGAKPALKPPKPVPPKVETPKVETPAPKVETSASKVETLASNSNGGVADMEVDSKREAGKKAELTETEGADEDDEVVREIDVFFNPSIDSKTQLYVVQYPLRPWWRPYELEDQCAEVRVKPICAEVEVDLTLDVGSNNFDRDRNIDMNMTKQTLTSSWKPPCATSYAVGVLVGNKLHLNPIHSVVQLRPSLQHLHPGESMTRNYVTSKPEGSVKIEAGEGKAGPSKIQRKKVDPQTREETNEERWVPLVYHGANSDLSSRYLRSMIAEQASPIQFAMNPYDYVNSLCPGGGDQSNERGSSYRRDLLSRPFSERIKKLLCEAPHVHRFSVLRYYAQDVSEEEFLNFLQDNGILVQGCWVANNSLAGTKSAQALARDYVLLLFSKKPVIHKSILADTKKVIADPMVNFLHIFAVERPSLNDWKFKQPTDLLFLKNHKKIVEKQEEKWERVEKTIMDNVRKTAMPKARVEDNINSARLRQQIMVSKGAESSNNSRTIIQAPSMTTMPPEVREYLPNVLQKIFQDQKVCSHQYICERLRGLAVDQMQNRKADARMAINAAAQAVKHPKMLEELLQQIAVEINGFFVLRSFPDNEEYDPLRKVVIDLLIGKGPNAKLKKAEIEAAARMKLGKLFSKTEINKVITDICKYDGANWVLKQAAEVCDKPPQDNAITMK